VIETPNPNLVVGMKWMLGVYTKRFNIRHKLCGHLFAGRYKALIVEGSGDGYLQTVCDYVHLNPVRAKLLKPEQALETFKWSSYPLYLQPPKKRPGWLRADRLLGEKGIPRDTAAGRAHFGRLMELRRKAEASEKYEELRRGWYVGSEEFRKELLVLAARKVGANHYGAERQETGEQKAERIVEEEVRRLRCTEPELLGRRKGDAGKVAIARRLRKESTMSFKWIAERLRMGAWTYVWNLLAAEQARTGRTLEKCK
jgi:putative transposase